MPMRVSKYDASPDKVDAEKKKKKKKPTRAALKAASTAKNFDTLSDSMHVDVWVVALIRDRSVASTWRDAAKGLIPAPRKFGSATRWNVGELRRAMRG